MGIANFITALLLFVAGIFFCAWFLWSLLKPFLGAYISLPKFSLPMFKPGYREQKRFLTVVENLESLTSTLQSEQNEKAIEMVRGCVYFEVIRHTPELVAQSAHHHTDLLEKMILIADNHSRRIQNLPVLESLFSRRAELLAGVLETERSKSRLSKKRQEKGKKTPAWSNKDFDEKISELMEQLDTNAEAIRKQIDEALASITENGAKSEESEHYH